LINHAGAPGDEQQFDPQVAAILWGNGPNCGADLLIGDSGDPNGYVGRHVYTLPGDSSF